MSDLSSLETECMRKRSIKRFIIITEEHLNTSHYKHLMTTHDCFYIFFLSLLLSTGDMAVKALCVLQDMKQSFNVFEKYQGTYLLLVHPDEKVFQQKSFLIQTTDDFSHLQCYNVIFISGATLGNRRSEDDEECGPGRLL